MRSMAIGFASIWILFGMADAQVSPSEFMRPTFERSYGEPENLSDKYNEDVYPSAYRFTCSKEGICLTLLFSKQLEDEESSGHCHPNPEHGIIEIARFRNPNKVKVNMTPEECRKILSLIGRSEFFSLPERGNRIQSGYFDSGVFYGERIRDGERKAVYRTNNNSTASDVLRRQLIEVVDAYLSSGTQGT